jgi:hypothetical protein
MATKSDEPETAKLKEATRQAGELIEDCQVLLARTEAMLERYRQRHRR